MINVIHKVIQNVMSFINFHEFVNGMQLKNALFMTLSTILLKTLLIAVLLLLTMSLLTTVLMTLLTTLEQRCQTAQLFCHCIVIWGVGD